jgi:hypothetical protein
MTIEFVLDLSDDSRADRRLDFGPISGHLHLPIPTKQPPKKIISSCHFLFFYLKMKEEKGRGGIGNGDET